MKKPKWNSEFRNYVERQKKVVIARTKGRACTPKCPANATVK